MVAAYNLWTPDVRRDIVNPYSEVERLQIMLSCSFNTRHFNKSTLSHKSALLEPQTSFISKPST